MPVLVGHVASRHPSDFVVVGTDVGRVELGFDLPIDQDHRDARAVDFFNHLGQGPGLVGGNQQYVNTLLHQRADVCDLPLVVVSGYPNVHRQFRTCGDLPKYLAVHDVAPGVVAALRETDAPHGFFPVPSATGQ